VDELRRLNVHGWLKKLAAGTPLPSGLGVLEDGGYNRHSPGHATIYPTMRMTVNRFNELMQHETTWQRVDEYI
jgi:hypothetical protein